MSSVSGDFDFSLLSIPAMNAELLQTWKQSLHDLYNSFLAFLRELAQNPKLNALTSVPEFKSTGLAAFESVRGKAIESMEQLLEALKELASALSRAIGAGINVLAELTRSGDFGMAEKLTYLMDQFRTVMQHTANLIMPSQADD